MTPEPVTRDPRVNTGAGFYLTSHDPRRAVCRHFLTFVKENAAGRKLLDLGCGVGSYAYELQAEGYDVTGVEPNPDYVAVAQSIGVAASCGGGKPLPFADGTFDTTYMLEVLEHIPDSDIRAVLAEVRRVTKHRLLVTVPDNTQYATLVGAEMLYGHHRAVDHVQFFTTESLPALLRQYFREVSVTQGDPLFPHQLLPVWVRKPLSALYRLGLLKPTIYSRLFAVASV
jgi:SAM-dependent methyltransferase